MTTIKPKGLAEILEEDASLKKEYTYQEYLDNKTVPHNTDTTLEEVYENYLKIKTGEE